MRKGFTLVELSIVLVIIGLLIGGILVAQSMIGTTKIQKVVRQLQQYDIAFTNFKTKFGQLPGDSDALPNPGDRDGTIDGWVEGGNVWYHLSLGVGLKTSKGLDYVPFDATAVDVTEDRCPRFDLDQDHTWPNATCLFVVGYPWQPTMVGDTWYYYGETDPNTGLDNEGFALLKASDALAIDQKVDDGKPGSGAVEDASHQFGEAGSCTVNNAYNSSSQNHECALTFEVGNTNGTSAGRFPF